MPGKVTFVFEWNRLYRQIDTRHDAAIENSNPRPRSPVGFPSRITEQKVFGSQIGHALGRWKADRTLVVETNYFADYKLLDGLIQTSDALTLSERYILKGKMPWNIASPSAIP